MDGSLARILRILKPAEPSWKAPARTIKTLENRLDQLDDPKRILRELERFTQSRCRAKTRLGRPCRRKGLANGRCRNHGGMSTGPKSPEGKLRALANLKQFRTERG